jgi:hypothetical protein
MGGRDAPISIGCPHGKQSVKIANTAPWCVDSDAPCTEHDGGCPFFKNDPSKG